MKAENIKFKAKRLDNGEWVEGDLKHSTSYVGIGYPSSAFPDVPIVHRVDSSTVCMFTGLKDCEGKEVWEGDILEDVDDDNIKYVVIFDVGAFFAQKEGLYIYIPLSECVGSLGNDVITYAKVVGNKFDKKK